MEYHPGLGDSVMFGQGDDDQFAFRTYRGAADEDPCVLPGVTIRMFGHEGDDDFSVAPLLPNRSCAEVILKGGPGLRDRTAAL